MATVQSCTLMRDADSGKGNFDEMNRGSYTLKYQIITDGLMGPVAVANQALLASPHPLPSHWTTYSYQGSTDALSYAREYEVVPDAETVKKWYITVHYRTPDPGEWPDQGTTLNLDPIKAEPDPTERLPVVWWDREVRTRTVTRDIDGKAILNKAQGLYPEEIEVERHLGVLVVEINVATLFQVIQLTRAFEDHVNSVTWNILGGGIPPRCAWCNEISCSPPQVEFGYTFFHLVFRFVFARDGENWDKRMLEMGDSHWLKNEQGVYIKEPDSEGNNMRVFPGTDVALNEDGTRRPDDQPAVFTDWKVNDLADFNQLPF